MSIPFSNTTTKNGIIQLIERNLGFDDGQISGDSSLLAQFTADINLAFDKIFALIFQVGGTWQFDDSNQSDYPIIQTNIVSGQRDYSFITDANGNIILDIYKVMAADSNGRFRQIYPVDVESGNAPSNFDDGANTQGLPISYDKLGNGIFLDPIPNYNYTNGLKIYVNREGSYFTVSDTSKKAGFAGLFHEYLAMRPSYFYALRKSLDSVNGFRGEMTIMENDIRDYFKAREKDTTKVMRPVSNNSR